MRILRNHSRHDLHIPLHKRMHSSRWSDLHHHLLLLGRRPSHHLWVHHLLLGRWHSMHLLTWHLTWHLPWHLPWDWTWHRAWHRAWHGTWHLMLHWVVHLGPWLGTWWASLSIHLRVVVLSWLLLLSPFRLNHGQNLR